MAIVEKLKSVEQTRKEGDTFVISPAIPNER
jgi:hypothetical protein